MWTRFLANLVSYTVTQCDKGGGDSCSTNLGLLDSLSSSYCFGDEMSAASNDSRFRMSTEPLPSPYVLKYGPLGLLGVSRRPNLD